MTGWVVYWMMGLTGHETCPEAPARTTESNGEIYTEFVIPAEWVEVIVNCRRSSQYMRQLVELLYSRSRNSLQGKISYAKNPKGCGFQAVQAWVFPTIYCGSNPILIAEFAKDLRFQRDEKGKEYLAFKRHEDPDLEKVEKALLEGKTFRDIVGPLVRDDAHVA